jgi:phospholipase/carboxylesterase
MSSKHLSLEHLIKKNSISVENPGLLLMLHGYGSDENDLFSFANELPEELFIVSAKAPYPLQPYGHAWYSIYFDSTDGKFNDIDQAKSSIELIAEFIDELVENYQLNGQQVTVLGFSQGAILGYALAFKYPQKVKNLIALSGYIDRDLLPEHSNESNYEHLQVYASHGTVDQVIPVEWARRTPTILDQYQIKNTYSEFPVGHGVAPQNFFEFKNWLLEQLKK